MFGCSANWIIVSVLIGIPVRQVGRVGHGGEVRDQAGLRRLVVVRRDDQKAVRTGGLGLLGQVDGVLGVVRTDPGHDMHPVTDRFDHGPQQPVLLLIRGGGRLTRGAADHDAVVAHLVDQVLGQLGRAVVVHGPVASHRRDHRGKQPPEWRRRVRGSSASCAD
jgi:hypothetical protein